MNNIPVASEVVTTTMRVKKTTLLDVQSRVGKKHVSDQIQLLLESWLRGDSRLLTPDAAEEPEIAEILAASVADLLYRRRDEWARDVAHRVQLRWPSGMILRERMTRHYMLDKQHLAEMFSAWLSERIQYHLKLGKDVVLFMDAGSAVLWLSLYLWPYLAQISRTKTWNESPADEHNQRSVTIITNNIPVAESYGQQCESKQFSIDSATPIVCELLGGTVQPRYAALTGTSAETRLTNLIPKNEYPGRTHHISILAGNYIRLHSSSPESPSPTPLIRGAGQQEVKNLYIKCAHEGYIVGSIGKLFRGSTRDINIALNLADAPADQIYKDVSIDSAKRAIIKLVTTLRTDDNAILQKHSSILTGLLAEPKHPSTITPNLDIRAMGHFCYPYDNPIKDKSTGEQLKIEFPHPDTRKPQFLRFYDIK